MLLRLVLKGQVGCIQVGLRPQVVLPASQAQLGADLYFDSSSTACSTKPSQAHVQSAAYKLSRAIHQRASRDAHPASDFHSSWPLSSDFDFAVTVK